MRLVRVGLGAVYTLGVLALVGCSSGATDSQTAASASTPAQAARPAAVPEPPAAPAAPAQPQAPAAMSQSASDLPPLPDGLQFAVRPPQIVRAVYEFAARHPEVLDYVPCFCSCERMGHQSNEDCFVAGRDRAGHVTSWETHGLGCEVCIDVAQKAMQMHNSGAPTSAIRAAVDAEFAGRTGTPTPRPPRGGLAPR